MRKHWIIITIDGFVATGKWTTASWVAKLLGYRYLDTWAMYRAVALYALRNNLLESSEADKQAMLEDITLEFHADPISWKDHIRLNQEDVEDEIRDTKLSSQMKPIVTSDAVRKRLGAEQQRIWHEGGIVVDGRDMGTVVFPDAELKLFLVGDKTIRAQRRYKEMVLRGKPTSLEDIMFDIEQRDNTDYLGRDAVNWKADDALELDTSVLRIEEQIQHVYDLAQELISKH